jgi:hypothetical protein
MFNDGRNKPAQRSSDKPLEVIATIRRQANTGQPRAPCRTRRYCVCEFRSHRTHRENVAANRLGFLRRIFPAAVHQPLVARLANR